MIGMAPSLIPACQLFGHASLCFALTNGGVHGLLLHRRTARSRDCGDHASRRWRGEQQDFPRTEPYAVPRNDTIRSLTLVGPGSSSLVIKRGI
jgi:hypothetical protein